MSEKNNVINLLFKEEESSFFYGDEDLLEMMGKFLSRPSSEEPIFDYELILEQ